MTAHSAALATIKEMKVYILNLILILLLVSCGNNLQQKPDPEKSTYAIAGKAKNNFELDFPSEPEVMSEVLPIKGQTTNLTIKSATTQNGIFLLYEVELRDLSGEVKKDPSGFFNGMLTYLMSDLGVQFRNLEEFEYNELSGQSFEIISPTKDANRTSLGKTLLINDKAYIWLGVSNSANSQQRVNDFINSYKKK